MRFISPLMRGIFGDYQLRRIYQLDLRKPLPRVAAPEGAVMEPLTSLDPIHLSGDAELGRLSSAASGNAVTYASWMGGRLAALCCYWLAPRIPPLDPWPLGPDDAYLVEIAVASHFRGKGLASAILAYSAEDMRFRKLRTLFADVWHSNHSSRHAFENAGWQQVAWLARFRLPLRRRMCKICIGGPRQLDQESVC